MVKKSAAIILTLVFMISAFSGCMFLQTNSDRDMEQVIATVGNSEFSEDIYKRDLANAYASQGASYEQSYGRSETINMLIDNLVNNRLIIQTAVAELIVEYKTQLAAKGYENPDKISTYLAKDADGNRSKNLIKLLNVVDPNIPASDGVLEVFGSVKKAQSGVNAFYTESLDYFEDLVKTDWKIGYKYMTVEELLALCEEYKLDPADEKKETLIAALEEYDEHKEHDHAPGEHGDDRPERDPDVVEDEFVEDEGIPAKEVDGKVNPRFEAYTRMENQLKAQDKTIASYLEERFIAELESQLINVYTEHQYKNMPIEIVDLEARYQNMLAAQKQKFTFNVGEYSGFLTSATKDSLLLYNPLEGYGYVKNLLIGFGEVETAALTKLKAQNITQATYNARREEILTSLGAKDLRKLEDGETAKNYASVIDPIDGFYKKEIVDKFGSGLTPVSPYTYQRSNISNEELSEFIDLIFAYNTDPGMFNNEIDYLSAPAVKPGEQEQFVQEFAEAAREVVSLGKGSFTIVGTDFGWHIILCTEKFTVGESGEPTQADFSAIEKALETTTYDRLPLSIKSTDTYKLYNAMREEIKAIYFQDKVEEILKAGKDSIKKFEKTYSDLLA